MPHCGFSAGPTQAVPGFLADLRAMFRSPGAGTPERDFPPREILQNTSGDEAQPGMAGLGLASLLLIVR